MLDVCRSERTEESCNLQSDSEYVCGHCHDDMNMNTIMSMSMNMSMNMIREAPLEADTNTGLPLSASKQLVSSRLLLFDEMHRPCHDTIHSSFRPLTHLPRRPGDTPSRRPPQRAPWSNLRS